MKQVKIEYEKCKEKMPHRPPDEIDFGLGFRAALRWLSELKETPQVNLSLINEIEREL